MSAEKDMTINVLGRDVNASKTLKDVGKAADDTADRLDGFGKVAVKSLAGLTAAAPAAGLAVAGGVAVAGGAFVAMTAVALKGNAEVAESWQQLGDHVKSQVKEMAAPLEGRLVVAAGKLQGTFDSLDLEKGFEAAGPAIDHLTGGVDQFARRAVPGMIYAASRSEAVFVGLRGLLGDVGDGVGELFADLGDAAPAAGMILDDFGDVARDALGGTGELLKDLSNSGVGTVDELAAVFNKLMDTVTELAGSGMPVLFGTASTVLNVLDGILSVAGPLAPALGSIVGVLLSAKAGAVVMGAAGDALGRVGERATETAAKGGKAAGALGKVGGALSAIGPYGAIAGAALMGVSAAADLAFGSADQLTQSLIAGGNAAVKANQQLAQNDATVLATKWSTFAGAVDFFATTTEEANAAVAEQRASMTTLERAQMDAAKAANDHSYAVEKYGESSDQATAAAAILVMRQRDLRGAQDDAARATKSLTERLLEQQQAALGLANENLGLRMAARAYEEAQSKANDAVKAYGRASKEATDAIMDQESAALRLIAAAGTEAAAHYANKDSAEAQTAALNATNAKALELAASLNGPVPAALAQLIANMDDSSLAALGATRSIDGTNNAVINLKDGKTIVIQANDYASATIAGIQTNVNNLRGKTIDVHIRQLLSTSGPKMADLGNPGAVLGPNRGGLVPGTGPDRDSVPAVLTPGEFVVTRKAVGGALPFLEALNRGAGGDVALDAAARAVRGMGGGMGGEGGTGGGVAELRVSFDWGDGSGLTGADRVLWEWIKATARARGEVVTVR